MGSEKKTMRIGQGYDSEEGREAGPEEHVPFSVRSVILAAALAIEADRSTGLSLNWS